MTTTNPTSVAMTGKPVNADFVAGPSEQARDMMIRQKNFLLSMLNRDTDAQIAKQNAAEVHTAFRLNGKLVGVMSESGFTSTGIQATTAYQDTQNAADKQGLTGEERIAFVSDHVSRALKDRHGENLDVETFNAGNRPTSGDMHAEMFGAASTPTQTSSYDMAYVKFFAQLYAQTFGDDPFAAVLNTKEDHSQEI